MTQHLTEHDVEGIAAYARIGLTPEEVKALTVDLNATLDSFEPLLAYDFSGVEPTYHPIGGLTNVMREDVEETSFTQAEALANAPVAQDGFFKIPSILGGGDAADAQASAEGVEA